MGDKINMNKKLRTSLFLGMIGLILTNQPSLAQESKVWLAEVFGLSCPLCANNIEKQLKRDKDINKVSIDLESGKVIVDYKVSKPNMEGSIQKAIEDSGFTVREVRRWKENQ